MGHVAHIGTAMPDAMQQMRDAMCEAQRHPPMRLVSEEISAPPVPAPYIPARFTDASFTTFVPDPAHDSQRIALSAVKTLCRRIHAGESGLLALIGTTGTGKSHLLYAAANALHQAGHYVHARPWYILADLLRYGGRDIGGQVLEASEMRDRLLEQPIIFLDEVRPTAGTAFDDTELAKLVCHAWDNKRSVLITTNVSPLTEVVGPAVASRFTQVVVTGTDRRQG